MDNMNSGTMSLDEIIAQLSSLKENSADMANTADADPIWKADVNACEAAISILDALRDEGVIDAEAVHDLFHDYRSLAKQYQAMHQKYEVAGVPSHSSGVWHCPACNRRTSMNHTRCHWCGKQLKWR